MMGNANTADFHYYFYKGGMMYIETRELLVSAGIIFFAMTIGPIIQLFAVIMENREKKNNQKDL